MQRYQDQSLQLLPATVMVPQSEPLAIEAVPLEDTLTEPLRRFKPIGGGM